MLFFPSSAKFPLGNNKPVGKEASTETKDRTDGCDGMRYSPGRAATMAHKAATKKTKKRKNIASVVVVVVVVTVTV
ncbi:hypothetical protein KEM55_004953, partial [Ascosphaera atra]